MKTILIGFFIIASASATAQEKMKDHPAAVRSIDGIVKEMLRIVSGEKGKLRNWKAFRNLFLPTAHFTVVSHCDSFPQPA